MKLRPARLDDYQEIVDMYKSLIETVYEGFEIGEDIFFYGTVQDWFKRKRDIIVSETDDGVITGFSVGYIDDIGIVKPYYFGDLAFVKEQHRKGRSAYLLYKNVVDYADQIGLPLVAKAFTGGNDKIEQIQSKFGEPFFMEFKRLKG